MELVVLGRSPSYRFTIKHRFTNFPTAGCYGLPSPWVQWEASKVRVASGWSISWGFSGFFVARLICFGDVNGATAEHQMPSIPSCPTVILVPDPTWTIFGRGYHLNGFGLPYKPKSVNTKHGQFQSHHFRASCGIPWLIIDTSTLVANHISPSRKMVESTNTSL